jgi:hypothetical protein
MIMEYLKQSFPETRGAERVASFSMIWNESLKRVNRKNYPAVRTKSNKSNSNDHEREGRSKGRKRK